MKTCILFSFIYSGLSALSVFGTFQHWATRKSHLFRKDSRPSMNTSMCFWTEVYCKKPWGYREWIFLVWFSRRKLYMSRRNWKKSRETSRNAVISSYPSCNSSKACKDICFHGNHLEEADCPCLWVWFTFPRMKNQRGQLKSLCEKEMWHSFVVFHWCLNS
jgi:hypothetical protein